MDPTHRHVNSALTGNDPDQSPPDTSDSGSVHYHVPMAKRLFVTFSCLVLALGGAFAIVSTQASPARAASCPDVELIFARGTVEPAPPLGLTGESFLAALRNQLPGKSVVGYGVNYPASDKFNNKLAIANSVAIGVRDTQKRVRYLAAACPDTKIVLGGYSQGATVAGFSVADKIDVPAQYQRYQDQVPPPLSPAISDKVAAIVLFAPPSANWLASAGAPPMVIGKAYRAKTIRYCIAGDTVCNGAPAQSPNGLHVLYSVNGDTLNAAGKVARRI